jgi:hypothetical protein
MRRRKSVAVQMDHNYGKRQRLQPDRREDLPSVQSGETPSKHCSYAGRPRSGNIGSQAVVLLE